MYDDCVFCNIINKQSQSQLLYEDDQVIVINDILPKAPVHILIIPKKHINSVIDFKEDDANLAGHIVMVAAQQAKALGVSDSGYKLLFNVGKDGGQVVKHVHMHLLGGKDLEE